MRIFIKDPYIGHDTQSRRVWPGEYDLNDPLLFGVGQSLLDTGYAVVVEGDAPQVDLSALTVDQLKELAISQGINTDGAITETDYIALISPTEVVTAVVAPGEGTPAIPVSDEDAAKLPPAEVVTEYEEVDLATLSKADLKLFAEANDVDVSLAKNKPDFLDAIHTAFAAQLEEVGDEEEPAEEAQED